LHKVENRTTNSDALAHKIQDVHGQKLKAFEAQVMIFLLTLMSILSYKVVILWPRLFSIPSFNIKTSDFTPQEEIRKPCATLKAKRE